jgi:hypothetical protein
LNVHKLGSLGGRSVREEPCENRLAEGEGLKTNLLWAEPSAEANVLGLLRRGNVRPPHSQPTISGPLRQGFRFQLPREAVFNIWASLAAGLLVIALIGWGQFAFSEIAAASAFEGVERELKQRQEELATAKSRSQEAFGSLIECRSNLVALNGQVAAATLAIDQLHSSATMDPPSGQGAEVLAGKLQRAKTKQPRRTPKPILIRKAGPPCWQAALQTEYLP